MTCLVEPDQIEKIVGITRRQFGHIARAVSAEQTVYILHSAACLDTCSDLRRCAFSRALDNGIDANAWDAWQDRPVLVYLDHGQLMPDREAVTS